MSNRDRQFSNFANALYMELQNIYQERSLVLDGIDADQCVIRHIARRAYDLVESAVWHALSFDPHEITGKEIIKSVPDMPELQEEEQE